MISPFELLPWQAQAWRRVAAAIDDGRLGHALLLAGPGGTGKRAFARLLAAALWCRSPREERLPCGVCEDCRQVATEAHSGYSILQVEEGKRDIPIEAVRQLCERSTLTSADGRAKVAIIEPADALNVNGINALLKTIEEPTPGSHLLLISERPLSLAPTLRSRCQTLRFAAPTRAEATAWLASQLDKPAAASEVEAALDAVANAPLRALALIDSGALAAHAEWRSVLLGVAEGRIDPLAAATTIGEARTGAFIEWLYGCLAGLLRQRLQGADTESLSALVGAAHPIRLEAFIAEVQDGARKLAGNVRALLVLESLTIGWSALVARPART